jgi:hypothetical protein
VPQPLPAVSFGKRWVSLPGALRSKVFGIDQRFRMRTPDKLLNIPIAVCCRRPRRQPLCATMPTVFHVFFRFRKVFDRISVRQAFGPG